MIAAIKQLFKKEELPQPITGEISWENSNLYSTKDFPKYNPDDLIGRKGAGIYRKMMLDDQVKAVVQFKTHAVLSRGYFFDIKKDDETGEPDAEHEKIADFFEGMIKNIKGSFSDNLSGMLSSTYNGFSISEKVYEPFEWDGKEQWGIKDIKLRPYDSFNGGFKTDPHGNLLELVQSQGMKESKIPYGKVIHFVHQPDIDVHYGESDLRACYRSWFSKDIIIKEQNIHLGRLAGGFLIAKVEGKLTPEEKINLQDVLKNSVNAAGIMVPDKVTMEIIHPVKTNSFENTISQHDKAIAKSILVPNLLGLSEQGNTGSYSQSQTQLNAFFWILDHIANRLSQTLNEQLFKELALWNFGTDDFPWFTFEPLTDEQKIDFAKAWTELVKGGSVTKSDADEARIRQLLKMPEKTEEEEIEEEPIDGFPDELPSEIPDNEDWIDAQPDDKADFIRKEFAEKPWLRRVNYVEIEKTFDREENFAKDVVEIMLQTRTSLESQITKIVGDRSLGNIKMKEFETVAIPKSHLSKTRKVVKDNLTVSWEQSETAAQKELPRKGFKRIGPGMDKGQASSFLTSKTMKIVDSIDYTVRTAVYQVLENGVKYDKTLAQIINDLRTTTAITDYIPVAQAVNIGGQWVTIGQAQRLENIARTAIADAVNQARMSVFTHPDLKGFVQAYEYSAILDSRVTPICEHLNGKILREFSEYTPPNHFQCRSILVPVTQIDGWDGKESTKPRLEPLEGFK